MVEKFIKLQVLHPVLSHGKYFQCKLTNRFNESRTFLLFQKEVVVNREIEDFEGYYSNMAIPNSSRTL